jgi:hypothetical protein
MLENMPAGTEHEKAYQESGDTDFRRIDNEMAQ